MIVELCLALINKLAGTAAWHGDDIDASVAVMCCPPERRRAALGAH